MKDIYTEKLYAVKCFTRDQDGRSEAYSVIARELSYLSSNYLLKVNYLENQNEEIQKTFFEEVQEKVKE